MRTLFGKPIRKETTEAFYPKRISLEDFHSIINQAITPFCKNMEHLGGKALKDKHIEEWFEQFLAWSEIEQEQT